MTRDAIIQRAIEMWNAGKTSGQIGLALGIRRDQAKGLIERAQCRGEAVKRAGRAVNPITAAGDIQLPWPRGRAVACPLRGVACRNLSGSDGFSSALAQPVMLRQMREAGL